MTRAVDAGIHRPSSCADAARRGTQQPDQADEPRRHEHGQQEDHGNAVAAAAAASPSARWTSRCQPEPQVRGRPRPSPPRRGQPPPRAWRRPAQRPGGQLSDQPDGKYAEPVPGGRRDPADDSLEDRGCGAAVTGSATGRRMPRRRPLRRSCSATGTAAATTGWARVPRLCGVAGRAAAEASRSSSRYLPRPSACHDRHRATLAETRAPSPLVAQCSPIGGRRLPLRRRSSHSSTPANPVTHTAPTTASTCPARPGPTSAATAGLTRLSRRDGTTCHNPNNTEDTNVAVTGPWPERTKPHSTPRKVDLLEQHRAQRDHHERGHHR